MSAPTLFAVPGRNQTSSALGDGVRKRKRSRPTDDVELRAHTSTSSNASSEEQLAEYTAVITPAERSQRRLAGLSLNDAFPEAPFPHKDAKYSATGRQDDKHDGRNTTDKLSLHAQHTAAMVAILRQCIMSHDYNRASRALGLLLRSEAGGKPIDVRHEGLWAIAAEILLRQTGDNTLSFVDSGFRLPSVSCEGFERTKHYYETLIVQFPQHKSWPGATNARDFCIAMFGLWIYITQQEADQLYAKDLDDQEESGTQPSMLQIKIWELERARKIAESMSDRMRDIVLNDDLELLRLQGLVALWTADLAEDCAELEDIERQRQEHEQAYDELPVESSHVERIYLPPAKADLPPISRLQESQEARALARDVMAKLERYTL